MIRGLFIGIARLIVWVVVFVILSRVIRMLIAPFQRRHSAPIPPQPPPSAPRVDYTDVQDASFTDVKEPKP